MWLKSYLNQGDFGLISELKSGPVCAEPEVITMNKTDTVSILNVVCLEKKYLPQIQLL